MLIIRIPPERICFEITETAVVFSLGKAVRFIEELRGFGCRFVLDDFGTGISSFAYLKSLQVDYLEINGTFVRDILEDKLDFSMVRSINEIGHVMGKLTIAEFVKNERILQWMTEIEMDYAQDYGVARPAPLEQLLGGLSQEEIKNSE
ncbi:EAL domain-containing protein [Candidatus Vondammii sp. HM_W22]|uniref:EAL domain-containing protein n=1 Tax=Candidatus Vondammii sp. HM_W22 TaxID=2687299 RepID=UPI002E7AFE46|nr:EAL domain-containing protein [Candidatus Vondammii sp. HM_W22]